MSSNTLVLPIVNTVLSTKVSLLPIQMNNNIYYNLKYNIEKKVQGKCNEFGYVIKVLKIEDYNDGEIEGENFSGSAVYKIRYLASLCVPIEKTQIITKIENINNAILLSTHGPISCVITPDKVNTQLFTNELGKYYYKNNTESKDKLELPENDTKKDKLELPENGTKKDKLEFPENGNRTLSKDKLELTKGMLIKVTILSKKLYKNDIMISLGFLDEIATQGEIDNYYKPELFNPDQEEVVTNELVEFHEDDIDSNVKTSNNKSNEFLI
jgi:DNA-directed RNA polymerase subunit E'/Rpb7